MVTAPKWQCVPTSWQSGIPKILRARSFSTQPVPGAYFCRTLRQVSSTFNLTPGGHAVMPATEPQVTATWLPGGLLAELRNFSIIRLFCHMAFGCFFRASLCVLR